MVAEAAPMKVCPQCGASKPATKEYWYWNRLKGCWWAPCKACKQAAARAYYTDRPIEKRFSAHRLRKAAPMPGAAPTTKYCKRCEQTKPLTEEHWFKGSDGRLFAPCLPCRELLKGKRRPRGRRTEPRAVTIPQNRMQRFALREAKADTDLEHQLAGPRPQTRADCVGAARPCPWVSCKHHLYLDVNPETGSIKFNYPRRDVDELTETCVLDVADRGGETLEAVGEFINVTRERIRQIEVRGLLKLKRETWEDVD